MSVPVNLRSVPKLKVLQVGRQLVIHTIKITSNDRSFPKRYRWCFTDKLIHESISMYHNLVMANSIVVINKDDKNLRRNYQVKAQAQVHAILSYIQLSYEMFGLSGQKVSYWTSIAEELKSLIQKWRDSDASRYRDIE